MKSSGEMSEIHNRMPVILERENENLWLGVEPSDVSGLKRLLKPYQQSLTIKRAG